MPCIDDVNSIFTQCGFAFDARVITNEKFYEHVLKPILLASENVADTSELFMRSYQMYKMFTDSETADVSAKSKAPKVKTRNHELQFINSEAYSELKIGKLAQIVLRDLLVNGAADEQEIQYMQTPEYCKRFFDLQYPLLVKAGSEIDTVRYYVNPITIRGEEYYMCSQWFETVANNDRPYLERWINKHKEKTC